jgi:hypothetical protein
MVTNKTILWLMMGVIVSLSFSASAEQVIDDDLIVTGTSDGTALAYDCSAATLPFDASLKVDPSASTGFIPAGDPILVPVPINPIVTNCDLSSLPFICAFTCETAGGAACIGADCINNESFDSDEVKLKENNLRIRFHDTSIADVLGQSWNVEANSSRNGARSYFDFQVKSLEIDAVALSDGTAPAYDCADLAVTKYPINNLPSTGTIPVGEPIIQPNPINVTCTLASSGLVCLHTCDEVPDYTVKSVLRLGTASGNPSFTDGVAIGYESAAEDGVISVGRADLARRIAHIAAGISATDALTIEGLQDFSVIGPQRERATLLTQQIADAHAQLDEIEEIIFPLELLEALSQEPPVLPSGEEIDTSPGGDMTGKSKKVNLKRLRTFLKTLEKAIHFADRNPNAACAQLEVNIGRLNGTPPWFATDSVVTNQLRQDMDRVLELYECT